LNLVACPEAFGHAACEGLAFDYQSPEGTPHVIWQVVEDDACAQRDLGLDPQSLR